MRISILSARLPTEILDQIKRLRRSIHSGRTEGIVVFGDTHPGIGIALLSERIPVFVVGPSLNLSEAQRYLYIQPPYMKNHALVMSAIFCDTVYWKIDVSSEEAAKDIHYLYRRDVPGSVPIDLSVIFRGLHLLTPDHLRALFNDRQGRSCSSSEELTDLIARFNYSSKTILLETQLEDLYFLIGEQDIEEFFLTNDGAIHMFAERSSHGNT